VVNILNIYKENDMQTLTEIQIKNEKIPGRYSDYIKGLHLYVRNTHSKYWILRFSYLGKRKDLSLGVYPLLSLKDARIKAIDAKKLVDQGINPISQKKELIRSKQEQQKKEVLFKDFAIQCVAEKSGEWRNPKHHDQWINTLTQYAFPYIGNKTLNEISTIDLLNILKPIWLSKTHTAMRLRGRIEWILGSASVQGLREGNNPALWRGHLANALPSPNKIAKTRHHAALPYGQVSTFVSKLKNMDCLSALALEFTILTAARTNETLAAKREEIQDSLWTIPAHKMKANKEQRVPLVERALEILKIAELMDRDSEYLFSRNGKRLSNMAMLKLVKNMGYKITVHGFRSTFRTWSEEETNYADSLAKKALAHTIKDKVDEAYNRGDLLKKRLSLMEDWGKFCNNQYESNVTQMKAA